MYRAYNISVHQTEASKASWSQVATNHFEARLPAPFLKLEFTVKGLRNTVNYGFQIGFLEESRVLRLLTRLKNDAAVQKIPEDLVPSPMIWYTNPRGLQTGFYWSNKVIKFNDIRIKSRQSPDEEPLKGNRFALDSKSYRPILRIFTERLDKRVPVQTFLVSEATFGIRARLERRLSYARGLTAERIIDSSRIRIELTSAAEQTWIQANTEMVLGDAEPASLRTRLEFTISGLHHSVRYGILMGFFRFHGFPPCQLNEQVASIRDENIPEVEWYPHPHHQQLGSQWMEKPFRFKRIEVQQRHFRDEEDRQTVVGTCFTLKPDVYWLVIRVVSMSGIAENFIVLRRFFLFKPTIPRWRSFYQVVYGLHQFSTEYRDSFRSLEIIFKDAGWVVQRTKWIHLKPVNCDPHGGTYLYPLIDFVIRGLRPNNEYRFFLNFRKCSRELELVENPREGHTWWREKQGAGPLSRPFETPYLQHSAGLQSGRRWERFGMSQCFDDVYLRRSGWNEADVPNFSFFLDLYHKYVPVIHVVDETNKTRKEFVYRAAKFITTDRPQEEEDLVPATRMPPRYYHALDGHMYRNDHHWRLMTPNQ